MKRRQSCSVGGGGGGGGRGSGGGGSVAAADSPCYALVAVGSRPEEAWHVDVLGMRRGDFLEDYPPFTRFQPWLHGVNLNGCRVSVVVNAGSPASSPPASSPASSAVKEEVRDVELNETGPLVGKVQHRKVTVIGDQPYVHIRIQLPPPVGT